MELLIPNSCEIVDKVSIAIPIYNCVEYVDECLDSILSQEFMLLLLEEHDYEDVSSTIGDGNNTSPKKQMMIAIEVSIYEDGSTDGTAELVDEWAKRVRKNETVFSLFSVKISKNSTGSPKGVGHGRNRAIEQSTGDWICFCDADDILHPRRIITQYLLARSHPNALVGSRFRRIPEGSTETFTLWANALSLEELKTQVFLTFGPSIIMPSWFCHRSVYERVSTGFDESGKGTPEDLIFFYKHLDAGGDVLRTEEVLLTYRYHAGATTFSVSDETIRNIRLSRLESKVLNQWDKFTIWNAGKSGRRLYRALSQSNKDKVLAFCDIDEKKLRQKTYHPYPLKCKIPIVHPRDAKPPFIICVKAELIFDKAGDFRQLIESLGLKEGNDFYYYN